VRGRVNDTAYREYISQSDLDIVTTLSAEIDTSITAVGGDSYGAEQAFGLYPTSGASDDYAFSRSFADNTRPRSMGTPSNAGTVSSRPGARPRRSSARFPRV
jgi:hypothetical protein